jgi:YgiT-type zinc finger domain-containing protein
MSDKIINIRWQRGGGPRPAACPHCGGKDLVPIVYGLPGSEMIEAAKNDEVRLGGCVIIIGEAPAWSCRTCRKSCGLHRG